MSEKRCDLQMNLEADLELNLKDSTDGKESVHKRVARSGSRWVLFRHYFRLCTSILCFFVQIEEMLRSTFSDISSSALRYTAHSLVRRIPV